MEKGTAKIQTGYFKIIHEIDIGKYADIMENIERTINSSLINRNPLYPFISLLITQIKVHLNNLQVRKTKRSLDFLGSAWKWIAGNPDKQDHEIVLNKLNNVLENNNNQVLINKLTIEKINEITNITNSIAKIIKDEKSSEIDLFLKLKFKLEIIKEEIVNVAYAIHWAKANIINSYILSNDEINIAKTIINNENIPFINLDEALEFSEVKIASNGKLIIYIISLPTVRNDICKTVEVRAVKKNEKINKINFNELLICQNETFGKKDKCKDYNSLEICLENRIIDLRNETCITNLLKSRPPNCTKINNQHIPNVEEISPGILFLNEFKGNINFENETTTLSGTFLIHFNKAAITIGKQKFYNDQKITHKPLPAILQPSSIDSTVEEILSLQMLHQLNSNNTNYIDTLERRNKMNYVTNFVLGALIVIITITIVIWKKFWKRKNPVELTANAIEGLNKLFNKAKPSNEDVCNLGGE